MNDAGRAEDRRSRTRRVTSDGVRRRRSRPGGGGPGRSVPLLSIVLAAVTSAVAVVLAAPASGAAAGDLIADSFGRSVTSGWGSAETGGSYTYTERTAFSVANGRGSIKLPSAGQSRQADLAVSSADQVSAASIGVAALPTAGNGTYVALLARSGGGRAYRALVTIKPGGTATLAVTRIDGSAGALTAIGSAVTLPGKVTANSLLRLELTTTGSADVAITARAWPAGTTPPAAQITQTDRSAGRITTKGTFAIWAYSSSSSGPSTVLVDDLSVRPPAAATPTTTPTTPTTTRTTPTTPTTTGTTPATAPTTRTTTPIPTTTSPAPAPPPDAVVQPDPASSGGAPLLGSRSYTAPAGALFVSPSGSDSAAGTVAAPYRTITKAISAATAGRTIVVRAGIYHESLTITTPVTIQPYNNEIVWLDGSSPVTGWVADGNAWRVDNWTAEFDSSPTYTRGAADNTAAFWGFVNPAYPMAAHPDQVWIAGQAQAQVGSRAELAPGRFYVDDAANRLYIGSDPTGRQVRASDLSTAIKLRAAGSVLQGFGVSRFAPSVPDMGTVTVERPSSRIENMAFLDNATTGLSVLATDVTVANVTTARNGLLGMHANYADRITVTNLSALSNNLERFNTSPVSGGLKITRTRGIAITGGQFRDNIGPGIWLDESTYGATISNNKMIRNSSHGISVELSASATLVNNLLQDNGGFGMKINDTSSVRIWNNTLTNNNRPINIVQDDRRASNQSTPGHDPRQPFPDSTMTWINGPVEVRNNVIAGTTGNCLLCVEDYSKQLSAEQMKVTALGNVYQRSSTSTPTWVVVWSAGAGNPRVFTTVAAFRTGTGQEAQSLSLDGTAATNPNGSPTTAVTGQFAAIAQPLPTELATSLLPAGTRRLGSTLTS